MDEIAYFDNAATTFPKPEEVYSFMDEFYRECGVNVGRGQYKLASKASSLVNDTRTQLLELMHAPNKKVVFTHTATEAINLILQGLPMADNYTIYISPFEHNAVTRVVARLAARYRLTVQTLAFDKDTCTYDLERIRLQFAAKKPNIVVISHASNVFGIVAPIHEICALSKPHGAINVVDMCQTAGLLDTDLSSNSIDFGVFAGHKTLYGPLGVAGFICSEQIEMTPLIYGGTGVDSQNQSMPDTIPERYEAASPNIHAISGLYAALKWAKERGINSIYAAEKKNHERLLEILSCYDNIRILSPVNQTNCIGVVSCVFNGFSSDNVGQILSENDIAVRTGLHCAPSAHLFWGSSPAGTVRFSVGYFTNTKDFERLGNTLQLIDDNL